MSNKTGILIVRLASAIGLMLVAYWYAFHQTQVWNLVGNSWLTVLYVVCFALIVCVIGFIVKRRYTDSLTLALAFIAFGLAVWLLAIYGDKLEWNGWSSLWLILGVLGVLVLLAINVFIGSGYYDRTYQVIRRRRANKTVVKDDDPTPDPIAPATGTSTTA